jgi:multidrug efflux pump subunit AcrA (membrane-fusion protein)
MPRYRAGALVRWVLVLAVLAAIGAGGAFLLRQYIQPMVTVTPVVEGPVVRAFYATGTLLPEREYPIKSNNPGMLSKVLVDKGDSVKQGQPLAIVEEDGVAFKFQQATADRNLAAAMADEKTSPVLQEFDAKLALERQLLEIAQREEKRVIQALEKNASSQSDLDRALDRRKTIATELETLKAQREAKKLDLDRALTVADEALKIAKWNLDRQTITSPIDGVVLDRPQTAGTRLAVNDHIMQIADVRPETLVMRAQVDEEDKTNVHLGQVVNMTLYAYQDKGPEGKNKVFQGKVKKVYDKADPDRRTFEVDVDMTEKDPGFSAGMTGELAFIIASKDKALVIPSQAVQGGSVWMVKDSRLVQITEPKLGLRSVERAEVLEGLALGDLVVISAVDNQRPGQHVRTQLVNPTQAANNNRPKQEQPMNAFH